VTKSEEATMDQRLIMIPAIGIQRFVRVSALGVASKIAVVVTLSSSQKYSVEKLQLPVGEFK
jgi:hypothetical protein